MEEQQIFRSTLLGAAQQIVQRVEADIARIERIYLADVARELREFFLQAQADRVAPADVGAAINVVANPAIDIDQAGRERCPLIGEMFACGGEHALVQHIDGVLDALERPLRIVMFFPEGWRAFGEVREAREGLAVSLAVAFGCDFAERVADIAGETKGRVSGQDDAEACTFGPGFEGVPACARFVREGSVEIVGLAEASAFGEALGTLKGTSIGELLD